ncbi:MAG: hypothetical protein ACYSOO_05140 [Planctomycetota bacterium]|jgi:hypothetical protein
MVNLDMAVPAWFTVADASLIAIAAFSLGVVLGHILGKKGGN